MLEKSRISSKNSYHIFEYLKAASDEMKKWLGINNDVFKTDNSYAEPNNLNDLEIALNSFGFAVDQRFIIYKIVAGFYCLKQIQFESDDPYDPCSITKCSGAAVELAAEYLSLNRETLIASLTSRTSKGGGSEVITYVNGENVIMNSTLIVTCHVFVCLDFH